MQIYGFWLLPVRGVDALIHCIGKDLTPYQERKLLLGQQSLYRKFLNLQKNLLRGLTRLVVAVLLCHGLASSCESISLILRQRDLGYYPD